MNYILKWHYTATQLSDIESVRRMNCDLNKMLKGVKLSMQVRYWQSRRIAKCSILGLDKT